MTSWALLLRTKCSNLKSAIRNPQSEVCTLGAVFHQSSPMGQKEGHYLCAVNTAQPAGEKGRLPKSLTTVGPYTFCGNTNGHRMPGVALETPRGGVVAGDAENIRL